MIDFNELDLEPLKPLKSKEKDTVFGPNVVGRFVIGCDPYDIDTIDAAKRSINVFIVYDKLSCSISAKVWTRRTFDEFVEWYKDREIKDKSAKSVIISRKFIKDGKPTPKD